jgi:adenine-specific DNA-methyltransferase
VLSYNNESWLGLEELEAMCSIRTAGSSRSTRREVATLSFDSARYVGARIGIFDPSGRKVGRVSHLSNQELLVIAGEPALVRRVVEAAEAGEGADTGEGTELGGATGAASSAVATGRSDRLQQAT